MKCRVGKEVIENTMGFREILGTAKLQPKPEIGKKKKESKLIFSEFTHGKLFKMLTSFLTSHNLHVELSGVCM